MSVDAAAGAPLKVTAATMERVRLGARLERCTMGAFVARAVDEFIATHQDELRAGLWNASALLLKDRDG